MHTSSMTTLALCGAMASIVHAQDAQIDASRDYEISSGVITTENDGTFNYQGYLEVDGEPANGMYSFRFEAFEHPTDNDLLSELHFFSPLVPVVDGLFHVDVQMGGDVLGGLQFWRTVGDKEMYLEIGVALVEGGPYTTLGTRSKVGWSARAQYAGISESLRFPYTDLYTHENGDPQTMISLTNMFGGTILELIEGDNTNDPIIDIKGETSFNLNFGLQNGALRIDAASDSLGILSFSDQYPVAGILVSGVSNPAAGILGQVNSSVNGAAGVQALNNNSSTRADLATDLYAGDFSGDVLVDGGLEVDGRAVRDYGSNTLSPIGPLAYASVSAAGNVSSGTSNISATWDAANSRYLIDVQGVSMSFSTYTASVTVVDGSEPRLATVTSVAGDLVISIWDLNSANIKVQDNFHIVIYSANPNAFIVQGAPNGTDPDTYYEQTGLDPIIGNATEHQAEKKRLPSGVGN